MAGIWCATTFLGALEGAEGPFRYPGTKYHKRCWEERWPVAVWNYPAFVTERRNFPLKCSLPCQLLVLCGFWNESFRVVFTSLQSSLFFFPDYSFFVVVGWVFFNLFLIWKSCRVSVSSTGRMNIPWRNTEWCVSGMWRRAQRTITPWESWNFPKLARWVQEQLCPFSSARGSPREKWQEQLISLESIKALGD